MIEYTCFAYDFGRISKRHRTFTWGIEGGKKEDEESDHPEMSGIAVAVDMGS